MDIFPLKLSKTVPLLDALTFIIWKKKKQDFKHRKRKAGKHFVVKFWNKTNADGVSPYQFPADERMDCIYSNEKRS